MDQSRQNDRALPYRMNSAARLNCGSSQTSDLAFLRDASKRGLLVHSSSEGLLTFRIECAERLEDYSIDSHFRLTTLE